MKLEICIDQLASARAARAGGADRIEVCGALDLGGITPSVGLVEQSVALGGIAVAVLIRPHPGGFVYTADDVAVMLRDIDMAKRCGARGVVLGALDATGNVDREVSLRLLQEARPLSVTFHRAFDVTPDPLAALDVLMELGFDRLLTSGQAPRAIDGHALIGQLVRRAGDRITILAGAGLTADQVVPLVRTTGVNELHASARGVGESSPRPNIGFVPGSRVTDEQAVRAIVREMGRVVTGS